MAPTTQASDFAEIRGTEYPWSDTATFLNAASFGPLPQRSLQAVDEFNAARHEAYRLPDSRLAGALARARAAVARLIGVRADEIALAPNTTAGLNLAAGIVAMGGVPSGDADRRRILMSDREFPANVYPWLALEREGFVVERVPAHALGRPDEDALLHRLATADDVAVFTISLVQFASGYRADLARFGRVCRERGILFVVDAIQGLGAVPLDVHAAGIDLLACGGQKWLCSPFGTGFSWIRGELCSRLEPRAPGWLSFAASQDFTRLLDYRYEFVDDARRFEAGTLAFQAFAGFAESVELIAGLGADAVWRHILAVQEPLVAWARRREDVVVVSDLDPAHRSGILCIRPPRAEAAHAALTAAGITCVLREGSIRISPHFYNTVAEMERVVDVLDATVRK